MTVELTLYVRLSSQSEEIVGTFTKAVTASLRRMQKRPPGDRTEAVRFDALHSAIEKCALASLWAGEPSVEASTLGPYNTTEPVVLRPGHELANVPDEVRSWIEAGRWAVELRLPHGRGETVRSGEEGRGPPPPLTRWQSNFAAKAAMTDRFKNLVDHAVRNPEAPDSVIRPSRIANSVLTETLRLYAETLPDARYVEVPVVYQDGSRAANFPLRAAPLSRRKPEGQRTLRFTLLSIRHVEMDAIVDGAWLRNSVVSRPRPAGLTDDLVFDISRRQLKALQCGEPVVIYMYQTGLEPAVMGFYRAVMRHLMEFPGTIAVVPYYFRGRASFQEGTPWTTE